MFGHSWSVPPFCPSTASQREIISCLASSVCTRGPYVAPCFQTCRLNLFLVRSFMRVWCLFWSLLSSQFSDIICAKLLYYRHLTNSGTHSTKELPTSILFESVRLHWLFKVVHLQYKTRRFVTDSIFLRSTVNLTNNVAAIFLQANVPVVHQLRGQFFGYKPHAMRKVPSAKFWNVLERLYIHSLYYVLGVVLSSVFGKKLFIRPE